jgi:hypothetical protein
MRILKNLLAGPWQVHRHFPQASMQRIQAEIETSENLHQGELRFAVEAGLHWHQLWRGISGRDRATEVFSQLHIWDTELNSGVLIYLLLADRDVEIVADRGVHAKVGDQVWNDICHAMEVHFRQGQFEQGIIEGVQAITAQLQLHFPATHNANPNELPDAPVVL